MPSPKDQRCITVQSFLRGNISSGAATKWLVCYHLLLAGTIIFYINRTQSFLHMNKFIKGIKTITVAMINICLLCGAGHVMDWLGFAGQRIRQFVLKRF
jgi:hypothetical protein